MEMFANLNYLISLNMIYDSYILLNLLILNPRISSTYPTYQDHLFLHFFGLGKSPLDDRSTRKRKKTFSLGGDGVKDPILKTLDATKDEYFHTM